MTDKMTDKIDLTSSDNPFTTSTTSVFAQFSQPFSFEPNYDNREHETKERETKERETKERETKEQPTENKGEELKIATPEEIKDAKHLAAIKSLVNHYEQDLLDDIKNKVDIITGCVSNDWNDINYKKCVRILKTVLTNEKTILAYMTFVHGYTDYKPETVNYSVIDSSIYNYYSFKTTLQEDYNHYLNEATKKRKLIEDIDDQVNKVLHEKRRRLT